LEKTSIRHLGEQDGVLRASQASSGLPDTSKAKKERNYAMEGQICLADERVIWGASDFVA